MARGGAVMMPDTEGAVPAQEPIASQAIRTIAPHETGGNLDIKQLVAGSTLYLPVYEKGALFSTGDAHFAQGDGESCGTAIESSAVLVARFEVLKGEASGMHRSAAARRCRC
jgi:formamidase